MQVAGYVKSGSHQKAGAKLRPQFPNSEAPTALDWSQTWPNTHLQRRRAQPRTSDKIADAQKQGDSAREQEWEQRRPKRKKSNATVQSRRRSSVIPRMTL